MPIRVVKIGGSLLDWPPLPAALRSWLAQQPAAFNVLVCGGGPLADVIRRADRHYSLGDELSHWLGIDVLSISARLLAAVMRDLPAATSIEELRAAIARGEPTSLVFDPRDYLRRHELHQPGPILPHSWTATSDSIAARLAEAIGADELVLLKSCEPAGHSLAELATAGVVDPHFPVAAAGLGSVRAVNLRELAD